MLFFEDAKQACKLVASLAQGHDRALLRLVRVGLARAYFSSFRWSWPVDGRPSDWYFSLRSDFLLITRPLKLFLSGSRALSSENRDEGQWTVLQQA